MDGEYDWAVGEEVVVTRGGYSRWSEIARIDRLTATQVIVGSRRYRRDNGREVGGHHLRPIWFISRGAERVAEARMEARRLKITDLIERSSYRLTREGIDAMRAASDKAEAFLREVGEWEPKP